MPPDDSGPWRLTTEMPGRRLEAGVVAMGTQVVVVGGYSTSLEEGLEITRTMLLFDTFDASWKELPPEVPVAWTHPAVVSVGGSLFVLGGLDRDLVAQGESYLLDLGGRVWERLTPMPAGLERGAAAVVHEPPFAYLFGGSQQARGAIATNLAVDLSGNNGTTRGLWAELPPLPSPRSHAAAARMEDGTFIVAGGTDDEGRPLAETIALAPNATAWTVRSPMPTARGGCAYGIVYGQLICAGGETETEALTAVEAYNPTTDLWTVLPDLPEPRAGVHGAVVGQRLYLPGGASALRFEPMASVYEFTLLDTIGQGDLGSR